MRTSAAACSGVAPSSRTSPDPAGSGPLLPIGPVLALAAVSGDGDAIDPAAVTTIPDAAVLYREAGWDYNRISVTYLAGYRVQPATDVMGARMLLRWLWQSQRGTIRRTAENWAPATGGTCPTPSSGSGATPR